jgi:hypothetical protein
VVFRFENVAINSASATLTGAGTVVGTTINGTEVIVSLRNVPDGTRLGITLNVNGVANAASANIGFLFGDVSGNGTVNHSDVTLISGRIGQSLSEGNNFIYDVNANGAINHADVTFASAVVGNSLP